MWGTLCPSLCFFFFFNFIFLIFLIFLFFIYIYIHILTFFFSFFIFLFFYFFNVLHSSKFKNNKIINKKNTDFWGLQICPSSIEFMSVTNVSNEMK